MLQRAAVIILHPSAEDSFERFYAAARRDTASWCLERNEQKFLRAITTAKISQRALWSNRRVRRLAQRALIGAVIAHHGQDPRAWHWITLVPDVGRTWERCPDLDLVSYRNTIQHHLRRSGWHGVGVVEIDVWKNFKGEPGRRLVPHVHFLGWLADPSAFSPRAAQADMRARRALENSLGAIPVLVKNVNPTPEDLARIATYMTKLPAAAKNAFSRGTHHQVWSATLPRGSGARLIEILSHLEAGDVFFSIGSGKRILAAVRKEIHAEVRPRTGRAVAPDREMVSKHWRAIRSRNGSQKFCEPRIITRINQRNAKLKT